jgi:hypothetical protein
MDSISKSPAVCCCRNYLRLNIIIKKSQDVLQLGTIAVGKKQ